MDYLEKRIEEVTTKFGYSPEELYFVGNILALENRRSVETVKNCSERNGLPNKFGVYLKQKKISKKDVLRILRGTGIRKTPSVIEKKSRPVEAIYEFGNEEKKLYFVKFYPII